MESLQDHTKEELIKERGQGSFLVEEDIWTAKGFYFEEVTWQEHLISAPYFISKYRWYDGKRGTFYWAYKAIENIKGRRVWGNNNKTTTKEPFTSLKEALEHVEQLQAANS